MPRFKISTTAVVERVYYVTADSPDAAVEEWTEAEELECEESLVEEKVDDVRPTLEAVK